MSHSGGNLLRALSPLLHAARAMGLLTYCERATLTSGLAFAPSWACAIYAALLCGVITAWLVWGVFTHNVDMQAWGDGREVWWMRGPAPRWLPLLQFKINFHYFAFLLVVPLLQLLALRAQPHLADLLRRAQALESGAGAYVALAGRVRLRLRSLVSSVLLLCAVSFFVLLPIFPAYAALTSLFSAAVCLIRIVVYLQFDAFAFFLKEVFRYANGLLDDWSRRCSPEEDGMEHRHDRGDACGQAARAIARGDAAGARAAARLLGGACDVAARLGCVFSPLLLLLVLHLYVSVACMLYYLVVSAIYYESFEYSSWVMDAVNVVSLLFNAVELLLLVRTCEAVVSEVNKSSPLVNMLLLNSKDEFIRHELQLLSLQILHRPVQFSACGFFNMDASLLYTIVGAVTMYLVILIQIQLSLGSANKI